MRVYYWQDFPLFFERKHKSSRIPVDVHSPLFLGGVFPRCAHTVCAASLRNSTYSTKQDTVRPTTTTTTTIPSWYPEICSAGVWHLSLSPLRQVRQSPRTEYRMHLDVHLPPGIYRGTISAVIHSILNREQNLHTQFSQNVFPMFPLSFFLCARVCVSITYSPWPNANEPWRIVFRDTAQRVGCGSSLKKLGRIFSPCRTTSSLYQSESLYAKVKEPSSRMGVLAHTTKRLIRAHCYLRTYSTWILAWHNVTVFENAGKLRFFVILHRLILSRKFSRLELSDSILSQ